ncbi:MAG: hypothetical protein RLZZ631_16 [Cyanobacteriota bacterium]
MADGDVQPSSNPRGGRGPRDGAGREPGGFRIRLSDNEMRAARAVQEAFGLRSTVAALGLSIRTVAQLLEEGKLDEVLAQHRASGGGRPSGGGERRGPRPERGERPSNRPNPFARPARPAAAAPAAAAEVEPAGDSEPVADAVIETSETASVDA